LYDKCVYRCKSKSMLVRLRALSIDPTFCYLGCLVESSSAIHHIKADPFCKPVQFCRAPLSALVSHHATANSGRRTSMTSSKGTTTCPIGFDVPNNAISLSNCMSSDVVYGLLVFIDWIMPMSILKDSICFCRSTGSDSDSTWTRTRAARYKQNGSHGPICRLVSSCLAQRDFRGSPSQWL
jgi:hypothetical protein